VDSKLFVGCPLWAHRPWVGRYLPPVAVGHELEAYSRFLNAVEGNATFYASPSAVTIERWAGQVHSGFRFAFKVPQEITHRKRLVAIEADLAAFLDLMDPLIEVTGALMVQLPPSFAPVDLPVLAEVLPQLSHAWRWAVEVRHPGFFGGLARRQLDRMLEAHGVERVLLDSRSLFERPPSTEPGRKEWETKPRVPALVDALTDRPIVRFIGSDHDDLTISGLQSWCSVAANWLGEGRTPTVFVHTPDNAESPGLARTFHAIVASLVPQLAALPVPAPLEVAEQGSLFELMD
jgi:uncharacterized protein YecE (DUF72 family)